MTPPSILALTAVCAALIAGCGDPGYTLNGSVSSAGGAPVAGAIVETVCTQSSGPRPRATTGPDGRFTARGTGFFPGGCELEVRAPGFRTRRYAIAPACRRSTLGSCVAVELAASLEPGATPGP